MSFNINTEHEKTISHYQKIVVGSSWPSGNVVPIVEKLPPTSKSTNSKTTDNTDSSVNTKKPRLTNNKILQLSENHWAAKNSNGDVKFFDYYVDAVDFCHNEQ